MTIERCEFKTEVKQLLDLMIHSLYSHKEIFLRELISNASDAIDKARYESLTSSHIMDDAGQWKIRITPDRDAKTLTVIDNGIGMSRDDVVEALGTIAHSGTKEFLASLSSAEVKDKPELIGQFGVGFYSSFMVADRVTVISRKAGSKDTEGTKWESGGDGSYTIEDTKKATAGTDVVLHLKEDELRYLEEYEIRGIIKKYSDYIEHPIVMEVEHERESELEKGKTYRAKEEEVLNSMKAIWLKDKAEIAENEYNEFYRHLSHDTGDPLRVIHYRAEGTSEFTALLFIPAKAPFGIFFKDFKIGPTLYVKRVQIMDHCETLLPPYLRFVKGVVDSSDLPLNVSREILQTNRQIDIIRKNIVKKVLDTLADIKRDDYGRYADFHKEFGRVLKEGIHFDFSRKDQIADLLLFESTKTSPGTFTTLEEYVGNMKPGQEDIYYITGAARSEVLNSPYLESFSAKGYEVLIMTDEVDDIIMGSLSAYKGKRLKSVLKGEISLEDSGEHGKETARQKYEKLLGIIREELKDEIKDVRLSGRLRDSACCLVTDEGAMDPAMEKLLRSMGQDVPVTKRIFEINPDHPLFDAINTMIEQGQKAEDVKEYISLLYSQALLLEGSKPKDPASYARSVSKLILEHAKHHADEKHKT